MAASKPTPTRATAAAPTRAAVAAPTSSKTTPARATTPAPSRDRIVAPKTPGPRLYRIMRTGLVIWTLLATALCIASIIATQAQQQSQASTLIHSQDLRDLRSAVSQAHAAALASIVSPSETNLTMDYWEASVLVNEYMLASVASATHFHEMNTVALAVRTWQEDLAIAHHIAKSDEFEQAVLATVNNDLSKVDDAITQAYTSTAEQTSMAPFIIIGIIASVLGGLGFVMVSIATARRSRRVINIGLTIGLLAVIAAIVIVGVYASKSSQISVVDQRISVMSTAQRSVWDSRAQLVMAVLDPDKAQSHISDAYNTILAMQTQLSDAKILPGFADDLKSIADGVDKASEENRASLVMNKDPWDKLSTRLEYEIDKERPTSSALVVPAWGYTAALSLLCVVAIISLLAGIHTRTKEYA